MFAQVILSALPLHIERYVISEILYEERYYKVYESFEIQDESRLAQTHQKTSA